MMGSAAATCLGMITGKSTTTMQGDPPETESASGFLAALGAAGPASASAQPEAVKSLPSTCAETPACETPVSELAAVIAAMLQTAPPPADEAIAAADSDVEAVARGSASPSRGATAAGATLLASMRAAVEDLAADAAASSEIDATEPQLCQALNVTSKADAAAPALPAPVGLRQLMQLMGQGSTGTTSDADATRAAAQPAPSLPDTAASPAAVKLAQGAAEFAQAMSSGAAANSSDQAAPVQPAPVQPATSAPNSMLAAASTNFASPVHQPAPPSADPAPTLHAAVGTARWADELGSRLTLMSLRGQHEGSLNLTPEHLGPLEVRISVNQNTANVFFGAQHADTRAAIAEAMPRLRELLGDAGITLGQSGVSHQAPRHGSRSGEAQRQAVGSAAGVGEVPAVAPAIAQRIALGLVDTYV